MPTISLPTVKALFAKSQNRCAFPGCKSPLVEETGTVTGEICHIRAEKHRGPRFEKSLPVQRRNSAENLILMCGRHHKLIDTEWHKYDTPMLLQMKHTHEVAGVIEISSETTKAAKALLAQHESVVVHQNTGKLAIHSPGAIVADIVNFGPSTTRRVVAAPPGSIGASQPLSAYCKYLISRYNEYQKGDPTPKSAYKYQAIYIAVKREFGNSFQDLSESAFSELVAFLQKRIDSTYIGKKNRAKAVRNYHQYNEHGH